MLRFYQPLPSSALRPYQESIRIELVQGYSSIFHFDTLPGASLLADMELYNLDFKLTGPISASTELSITAPFYYAHDGFMDGFLHDYHSALGLPNAGREFRPDNEFAYFYNDPDGDESWHDQAGWEFGDIAIGLRHKLTQGSIWSTALLTGMTLPTGSRARGWGTGKSDIAIGGVASWLTGKWFGHLEAHLVHHFAEGSESTSYRDYARLSTTVGYQFVDTWSLLGQVQGGSSPYNTSLQEVDEAPWLVALGGRMRLDENNTVTLIFTEGITQATTPDFSFTIGLEFGL
jgi:hypothetical protein